MKKRTFFKTLVLFAGLLFLALSGWGQTIFVEDFNYPVGSLLTNNGWTVHSGSGNQIDVSEGLSFSGYLGSGVSGGAALLDNYGEDVHKNIPEQTTGTIYIAFVVQTEATNYFGYFFNLGQTNIGTLFFARVYVTPTGDGIALGSGTTIPTAFATITPNVPALVVVKLNLDTKLSEFFVFSSFPEAEPETPFATLTETMNFSNVGSIALRQYNANQRIIVDGIRVSTTWAGAVTSASAPPIVTFPTISPSGGNFYGPVEVSLSTLTEGASIYYTTDGSDPDNTDTEYTAPIEISSTTTLKAIAYADGYDPSAVASATYTFPEITEVSDIAALRAGLTDGTVYKLTGEAVLTFQTSARNAKYIQDASGAILIDDNPGVITTTYNLYDGITGLTGTLGTYNGMLQLTPVLDPGAATSTGNTVTPFEVTLANLTTDHQAKLVKIVDVTISDVGDGTGNFVASENYPITDASKGTGILRTAYSDLDYIGSPIPQVDQDITGVVLQYNTDIQLVPRSGSDFADHLETDITFYFRPPSNMDYDQTPQIWGAFNNWQEPPVMVLDPESGWWKVTVAVQDITAPITYQSRYSKDYVIRYQKATGDFNSDPTFITTTGEIWIDASDQNTFTWDQNHINFYLPASKITEIRPQLRWVNMQYPGSGTISVGGTFDVYAQVYEPRITDDTGQGAGIAAWIGYSTENTDPATWTNWVAASFNVDVEHKDEYKANIGSGLPAGNYYYASRFKLGDADYAYGGFNAGGGGFWDGTTNVSGVLTVYFPLGNPIASEATNVLSTSFTANWEPVADATGYKIDVYKNESLFTSDLLISEYVEGSSLNKYLEIFNGTGNDVDLSDYEMRLYINGAVNPSFSRILSGFLANGNVIIYKNQFGTLTLPAGVTANTLPTICDFNGNDALALYKISTDSYVDIFGVIGNDPGSAWIGDGGYTTVNKTLVRKSDVSEGITVNPTGTGTTAFTTLTTEWDMYDEDIATYLGSHTFTGGISLEYVTGFENLNVGNATSYEVTGLDPETTYYYVVRAYNAYETSEDSNEIEVITPPKYALTFYVDMTNAGEFTEVQVAGDFQGAEWPGTAMTLVSNNIYTYTTDAIFEPGAEIAFKFRKVTGTETIWESGANRTYTVVTGSNVYHGVWDVMVPAEISWANLQFPASGNILLQSEFNVYAKVYAPGLTGVQGDAPNLKAWIGYSTEDTDPSTWTTWAEASFNMDYLNDEEYVANIGGAISEPGTYYYASRFQLGEANYVYGGYSESGGGFWDGTTNVSGVLNVSVSEPSDHVTGFTATADAFCAITLSWTDSDGSGYLIKGSTVGYEGIISPVDGTPEVDDLLVANVDAGIHTFQFTGLSPETPYYFKIYPYNGSELTINYKTDGPVPQVSETTPVQPPVAKIFISEYIEGSANNKAIEIYNGESTAIDLSKLTVNLYSNGSTTAGNSLTPTGGFLNPGEAYVIANASANGEILGISDVTSTVTFFNGNDAIEVIYDWQVTDVFGEIGVDPGTNWSVAGTGATSEYTLLRKLNVTQGNTAPLGSFGTTADNSGWVVKPQDYSGNLGDFGSAWTGAISSAFYTSGNWDLGFQGWYGRYIIPPRDVDPVITEHEVASKVFIKPGGVLTIGTGSSFSTITVYKLINLAGTNGLVIKTGSSFIHWDEGVEATMERNIPLINDWYMISSPVSNMMILDSDFAPEGPNLPNSFDFYSFDQSEPELTWINLRAEGGLVNESFEETFTPGKGYLVAYSEDYPLGPPFAFKGILNTVGVEIPIAYTPDKPWAGWNLIGNPFASGIDWSMADKSLFQDNYAYVYDRLTTENGITVGYRPVGDGFGTQPYGAYGPYIGPNQGFFVLAKSTSDGANFQFSDIRAHYAGFTKDEQEDEALVLRITHNSWYDETIFGIREGTSFERDRFDALKLFSFSGYMPQVYSYTADQVQVAINSIPQITEDNEFTLGLRAPASGQYTLSVNEISGVFQSNALYLKDLQTGAVQNLQQSPEFSFQANAGDDPARFIITFAQPTGIADAEEGPASIYTWNRTLYLNFAQEAEGRLLQVFDLSGRLVMSDRLDQGLNHTRSMNLEAGVYLVRVSSPGGVATQRVFVK